MSAHDAGRGALHRAEADIPRSDGAPLFPEAWHARAFALIVALTENRQLGWKSFQTRLVDHFAQDGSAGASENDETRRYFECWLEAAEETLMSEGFLSQDELAAQIEQVRSSADHVRQQQRSAG